MKTFKDLFLDQSADVYGTPRRIIKASLRMATAENGSPTGLAQAGSNEDDLSESGQKSSEAVADKSAGNLPQDARQMN
jgi:ferritin-like metal-binding protein YciE